MRMMHLLHPKAIIQFHLYFSGLHHRGGFVFSKMHTEVLMPKGLLTPRPLTAGTAIRIGYTLCRGCTLSPHDILELNQV